MFFSVSLERINAAVIGRSQRHQNLARIHLILSLLSSCVKTGLVVITHKPPMCGRHLLKEILIGLFC